MTAKSKKFIENAANALMTIQVSIGRWTGVAKLPKAAAKAADDEGANPQAARLYVNLLGSHHADLKKVNAAFSAIRTYLYDHTLPLNVADGDAQRRGDRLIPVAHVPKVMTDLKKLCAKAETALAEFLPEYDRLVSLAQSADLGGWRREARAKYPTADEVRRKFYAVITPPKPLPSWNLPASLPADLAAQIADAGTAALADQLDRAKVAAIQQAKDHVDTLVKQLDGGQRLHGSLLSNAKRVASTLRELVKGYDNDPRALALADLIESKVANVANVEQWKASDATRADALKAAQKAQTALGALGQRTAKIVANKSKANVILGGVMGDA